MLPYSRKCFEELLETGRIAEVTPSELWYEERTSYGPEQMGVAPVSHPNRGFELLQGPPIFSGKILGGCIDTLFDLFDPGRMRHGTDLAGNLIRYRYDLVFI